MSMGQNDHNEVAEAIRQTLARSERRSEPHRLVPLDLPTRPDPTRAEMAMHMPVPDELSVWQATAIMGEAPPQWSSKEDIEVNQRCVAWWLECEARYRVMQADALRAALDRKEAK